MSTSKAQQKAVSKYMKANYDVFQVRMPKGHKAKIKAHADTKNESVNSFINRAIDETMERDNSAFPENQGILEESNNNIDTANAEKDKTEK